MKKSHGLLAIDVDGTLLTDQGHITDKVYEALEKASKNNWEVVLASGRTHYAAMKVLKDLPFIRYAVLNNGACIMNVMDSSFVHIEKLDDATLMEIIPVIRQMGAIPALYNSDLENPQIYYDTLDGACEFFEWYVTNESRCIKVDDVLQYTNDVVQLGMIARKEDIMDIRNTLEHVDVTLMALPFESSKWGGKNLDFWFLQIVPKSATKYNGIRILSSMLGIPCEKTVAVGDNYNDADMIDGAAVGVAMGNSPEVVKNLARVVVGSNNDSGLSEVVDRVLLSGEYFSDSE